MTWSANQFAATDFVRAPGRPPSQTGKMTTAKLAALIKAGYGQGHFNRYKPWLRVTKNDYSPNSFVGHLPAPDLGRQHHPRAISEWRTIHILKWLGAVDVRDAYPVWPFEHDHPGRGLPGFEDSCRHPGLIATSQNIGIKHGRFHGTNIPYVATIDLLTTWKTASGKYHLLAVENKPANIVDIKSPPSRAKERLKLTGRYCQEVGIQHRVIHAEKLPLEFCANIDALAPQHNPKDYSEILESGAYLAVVESLNSEGYQRSPNELLDQLRDFHGYDERQLTEAFHVALWRQDVDHDLTLPLRPWEPLKPGGVAFRRALLATWIGDLA